MKKLLLVLGLLLLFTSQAAASDVAVWSDWYSPTAINNLYNNVGSSYVPVGTTSTIISGISGNELSGIELLWAIQPADAYNATEIAKMASFLNGGGRIAFMGEHGGYAPQENARITAAIAALGGHITINTDAPDAGAQLATRANGQILTHTLTDGVDEYGYACFASLNLSGAAQALMLGTDHSLIMMGYENIGSGSIFLITDQNVWENGYGFVTGSDNGRMFANLLLADTGAPPVNGVPEPATLILLGLGLVGLAGTKKALKK